MRRKAVWVLAALLLAPAAHAASDDIQVSPRASAGAFAHYPRLTRFPDARIRNLVNTLLAGRDAQERKDHDDCRKMLREAHLKMDKDSYWTTIEVTHVSRRFLSIAISGEYYCGGAHPDHGTREPLTIDLSQGKAVDWNSAFKPGFLAGPKMPEHPGLLAGIYAKHYAELRGNDAGDDCPGQIRDDPPRAFFLSLDAKEGGLVVEPEVSYAMQACADGLTLKAGELAPYIGDPNLIAELRAMAKSK